MSHVLFTLETAHNYGGVFPALLRFRGHHFAKYEHAQFFRWMEFDEFDNPYATYLVSLDDYGDVRGCARLIRCHLPYMLARLWPAARPQDLPSRYTAAEVSRFALESREALPDMVAGLVQYAQEACLEQYLFLSIPRLIARMLGPHATVEPLGAALPDGNRACRVLLTPEILQATLDFHAAASFARGGA